RPGPAQGRGRYAVHRHRHRAAGSGDARFAVAPQVGRRRPLMTNWGVLGAARINQHVLEGAVLAEGASVIAIAARDRDRAQAQADTFDIATVYGSYDELLANPEIEAVSIPLPNSLHVEWS